MSEAAQQTLTAPLGPVVSAALGIPEVAAWNAALVAGEQASSHARVSEPILPLLVATAWRHMRERGVLVITAGDDGASRIADAVGWYIGDENVGTYPSRGITYGSGLDISPSRAGERERARTVAAHGGVMVATVDSLVELVPPAAARPDHTVLNTGDLIERDDLVSALVRAGYVRAEQAEERGQIAVRGDIVDIYPTTGRNAVRIELFDDEIERIRWYSSYTQRSLGDVSTIEIMPATDAMLQDPGEAVIESANVEWWRETVTADEAAGIESLPRAGSANPDGAPHDPVIAAGLQAGALEFAWSAFVHADGPLVLIEESAAVRRTLDARLIDLGSAHADLDGYAAEEDLDAFLASGITMDRMHTGQQHKFDAEPPVFAAVGPAEAEGELAGLVSRGLRVVVTFPHIGHATRLRDRIRKVDANIVGPTGDLGSEPSAWFAVSPAAQGFVSRALGLAVVPSGRLFRQRASGGSSAGEAARAMQAFTSLRLGDYVVHEDHGVGRFAGFETKTVAGVTRDYLYLEFQGEDRLYVPHEQMGKVTRYVGADGSAPGLAKLGGKRWANLKNRARTAVREMAGELLALYARRAHAVGMSYPEDDEIVTKFELSFGHSETEDQLRAIESIKEDMERPQPMDRLLCGDVGFGKTEVSLRAAVKAVSGGKQVMVLVPTTVLAQQHMVTFRERVGELPIEVDMVSRFRKPKDVKRILGEFNDGKIDILIGTHRILGRDVLPKDLGLVILDEEQRFGVKQKELLRQLRLEVDVLSMSATPIPRTLHMSLTGMRDISIIETPPPGRRPIHTHVGEYDEELLRMAIERELEREGQVFYLHNRVETIDECAAKLQQVCPRARIAVGHGQMSERQLEQVMMGFSRGDYDVLVATTIIESGLDIPSANTLIIERADVLGMSQLHQIRGRVGRSSRSSYAYLFYPLARELSEEARARLTALSDFSDLGAGARIAMRDLELRGAGNLLGAEQSGHVAAVGFELYVEMLAEAISEMSGEPPRIEKGVNIDARVDAFVPADYVESEAIKIDIHRRIALARDEHALEEIMEELADRFGEVPEPVCNLIRLSELRLRMEKIGADRLTITKDRVIVAPVALSSDDASRLRIAEPLAVYSASKGELQVRLPDPESGIERAKIMLDHAVKALED